MKMMSTSNQASAGTESATQAQPSAGGIAPDSPPITMFCGVRGLRMMV